MSQPNQSDLERYLQRVRDQQAILDLSMFQERQERDLSLVRLDEFYVPLRLAGQQPDPEQTKSPRAREEEHHQEVISDQLLDPKYRLSRHITILGDAGSGKTTLLRQLCGALAHARLANDPGFARERTGFAGEVSHLPIPIFVPLRYYHHYCRTTANQPISRRSFLEFLPEYFHDYYDLALDVHFYRTLLAGGQGLLALDGFDEVPDTASRRQVIAVVRSLAADSDIGHNMIMLSSRVAAYGGETQLGGRFQTIWVQNLNAAERATQVTKWAENVSQLVQRPLKAADILDRMPEGSPLDQLAVTPIIVTAICVVYFYDHQLPEQRARLYRRCVDIMLHERLRPDEPGQELAGLAGTPDFKRALLARLAFEMHQAQKESVNKERAALWLKDGFKSEPEEERLPAARSFLDSITTRGTLLQERDGLFGFGRQHLTFQEFLAGYHLSLNLRSGQRQRLWPTLAVADRWREPIRLAVGATMPENAVACEDVLHELLELSAEATDPALRLAGYKLAAEALWDLGSKSRVQIERELQLQIRQELATCLTDPAIADPAAQLLTQRAAAGQALGRLGDPRQGVTDLPPLLTAPIRGEFQYGDKKEMRETAPFQAAIYPITNAQFTLFFEAGGYNQAEWWSEAGLAWLESPPNYRQTPVSQPEYWPDDRWNNPNHPVVGVSWYEAEAFCNWLTATSERAYRLPTEEEWERLARGQHGRDYPWGNTWQTGLCNTTESELGQTSAVGLFPEGVSPTGVHDCAGNVWEWCLDWSDKKKTVRVLRGGSWYVSQFDARCASRLRNDPDFSGSVIGFRVVSPI